MISPPKIEGLSQAHARIEPHVRRTPGHTSALPRLATFRTPVMSLSLFLAFASFAAEREFAVVIDQPETEYTIEVGGTIAPENLAITIENLGDTAVVNPRMTVNGLYDWYDVKSIAAEVTRDCQTDEEKAMAIWWWVLYKRFQRSPSDRSALHPVRAMNGYGYGVCGHTSAWLKALWTAAGVRGRVQEIWGHTISEAYWDGAWHVFDGNVKVFYLDRDNRTIASLATLEKDKWLIERGIHPRDPWLRQPDPPGRNAEFVRYIVTAKDNYEEHSYDSEIAKDYTMAMTLRPGEKLIRWWKPELGKFEGRERRPQAPALYANGQLVWEPDLRRIDIKPYLSIPHYGNIATQAQDGRRPAIHVADLQDKLYTRPAVFTIPVASPYPIVGARFTPVLVKQGAADLVSVFFGAPTWAPGDVYNLRESGTVQPELDLDPKIVKGGVTYRYGVGFAIRGNASATPPTEAGLDGFRLVTDLQVSPHSLPALALGKNKVRFWRASSGPAKIKVTHRWREFEDRWSPAAVTAAVGPGDRGETDSLAPVLKWAASADRGEKAVDYQVMVSLRPDCRWPLSPTLWQNVGSERTEWVVPTSFLNRSTTYYWRVRARDRRGEIGEWSPVFQFRTSANAR
jgi:hypothetical protein